MTTTPRGAPELVSGQAIPETSVNEAIRQTEAGAGHFLVADNDLTAPPGACADGASYIIAATATGAWAGKEGYVATAVGTNAASGWLYHAPKQGYTAYIQDENARHLCDGSAWALDTTGGSYTDEQARDALGTALTAGTGITVTPNDGSDIITIATTITQYTDEMARDALGTALVAGSGITVTPNDGADTITIAATGGSLTMASTVTQSGTPVATSVGFLGAPQMSDQDDYTLALTDSGGHYYHVSGTPHTLTIPANGSIAFPIGTVIAIVNENGAGAITLAITSDTLRWGSSTGSRTIAANGTATLLKVTSTVWRLTGDGIT